MSLFFLAGILVRNPLICSSLTKEWCIFANPNLKDHGRFFDVDEIPLEGEIIKEHAGFTDVFFYSDCTNPYAGYVLDLRKLKAYNQFIYPLAMILNRKL